MPITSLKFSNVGPFDEIEFEFDKHVNVFAGPNNSGKSTALLVLASAHVFPFEIPERILRNDPGNYNLEGRFSDRHEVISSELPSPDLEGLLSSLERLRQDDPRLRQHRLLSRFDSRISPNQLFTSSIDRKLKTVGFTSFMPAMTRGTDYQAGHQPLEHLQIRRFRAFLNFNDACL